MLPSPGPSPQKPGKPRHSAPNPAPRPQSRVVCRENELLPSAVGRTERGSFSTGLTPLGATTTPAWQVTRSHTWFQKV